MYFIIVTFHDWIYPTVFYHAKSDAFVFPLLPSPGGRGMKGNPIIVFPEFPAFDELGEEELKNVLGYLTSVPRLAIKQSLISVMNPKKTVLSNPFPLQTRHILRIHTYIFSIKATTAFHCKGF